MGSLTGKFSKGILSDFIFKAAVWSTGQPENVKVTRSKNALNFEWDKDQTGIGSPNDSIMILLYNKEGRRFLACYSGAGRSELKDTFPMHPAHMKNRTYEVFLVFKDVLSDAVSKSVYCGSVLTQVIA